MGKGRTYKKGQHPGLVPRNHPRSVSWAVDFDYLGDLSPEEREWLGRFADGYYKADPQAMTDLSPEDKRRVYNRKNAANRDAYTAKVHDRAMVTAGDSRGQDTAAADEGANQDPTPEYLSSPEYKAALAEYRATLHPSTDRSTEPTPAQERARRRLRSTTEEL